MKKTNFALIFELTLRVIISGRNDGRYRDREKVNKRRRRMKREGGRIGDNDSVNRTASFKGATLRRDIIEQS